MAGPDAAVTDTHPLLFHAAGRPALGKRAGALFARAENRDAIIYVPVPVIWETSLLARIGQVALRRSPREFFADLFSNPCYQPLALDPEQVFMADESGLRHDPFDALIVAAAQSLELPLITRDTVITDAHLVTVLW